MRFLVPSLCRKAARRRQKQSLASRMEVGNIVQAYSDGGKKVKTHVKLILARGCLEAA